MPEKSQTEQSIESRKLFQAGVGEGTVDHQEGRRWIECHEVVLRFFVTPPLEPGEVLKHFQTSIRHACSGSKLSKLLFPHQRANRAIAARCAHRIDFLKVFAERQIRQA